MEQGKHQRRVTRPRKKEVDYHEPAPETPAVSRVPYEAHAQACLTGSYGRLKPLGHPKDLTVDLLRRSGFQDPVLVHAGQSIFSSREALGMRVPEGLSPAYIAAALGPDTRVPTIDVNTQASGPRMTLAEWGRYYDSDEKERLLNVVSLSLAGTPLQEEVTPPAAVTGLNLVEAVWPPQEKPRPEVLLYGLMSPAGCYTDFHVDFGGSSIWYHVVKGRKTFLLVPPTPHNMKAFEDWSSSDRQGGIFYADRAEGCLQATLSPGSTLLIPSSWPHAVVTQEDAVVVGGNFLHALELRRAVECWEMESRLKVHASARFPLFEPLMWHTMAHFRQRLLSNDVARDSRGMPTAWELTGLMCVLSFLKRQMDRGDWFYCPKSIEDPEGLLRKTEQAASGVVPEDLLPDLFSDLDPLDPDPVIATPGDLLLEDSSSLLDDLGGGIGLPLPDVASPHWLGGMGPSNSDPGAGAGGSPSSGESEEAAEEAKSSGDEWTVRKQSRRSAAQRASQQRLGKLRAAKAAREAQKRQAAEAATRLAAREGEGPQPDSSAAPSEPVITMKASARVAQAAREGKTDSKREALRAQMMVLHLRSRIQKELGMQADAAAGKLQLKDSGARLQEGISETAARLAQALSTLAQHGAAEPHWPPQCFQSRSLHFIDIDGQVQGPFSAEHLKVLQEPGAVQEDTLVLAATKGPSLLKDVMQMYEQHRASPSARSPVSPVAAQSGPRSSSQALAKASLNGQSTTASQRTGQSILRPGHTPTSEGRRQQDSANSSRHQQSRRDRSRQDSTSRFASSRAAADAAEAQRKIEAARARRAQEQRGQEEARRRAHEEHRCRAAHVAAQRNQSKPSWAEQAAAELALAELAGDGAYQGSWTFMGSSGQEMGPYIKSELIALHDSGKVDGKVMVYDEEDGVTIQLSALVASTGRSGLSPELPVLPEAPAQQPEEPNHASAKGLAGSAERHSVKEQLYSALDGDEHCERLTPQATSSARPRSPKRSTGQYLPGLAPATEVRKRAAELREQHLAKLKRLAGSQRDAASGGAGQTLGLAPADDGTPPPPPPLPVGLLQTDAAPAPWKSAAAAPVPARDLLAQGSSQPETSQHAVAPTGSWSASRAASGREPNTEANAGNGHLQPAAAPPWQRQQGHDSASVAPPPSGSGWWQQQEQHVRQGRHLGDHQTGQLRSGWQASGIIMREERPSAEQMSFQGGPQKQANDWQGSSEAQALGAGSAGYAGQPGNLGSMLQGIMSSVHNTAGASPAHLHHAPAPGHMGWPSHDTLQYSEGLGGHVAAVGQHVGQLGGAVQRREAMAPYEYVHPEQTSQQGVMGNIWHGR